MMVLLRAGEASTRPVCRTRLVLRPRSPTVYRVPIVGLRSQIKHGMFLLLQYRAITTCHTLKHSFHD